MSLVDNQLEMYETIERILAKNVAFDPASELASEWVPNPALPRILINPRVAFGLLVESGLVPPGTVLMDAKRRWKAAVRADGSLSCGPLMGSIHKVGAGLNKAPSCNGWTFWHLERKGQLVPLDVLRQEHLAGLM